MSLNICGPCRVFLQIPVARVKVRHRAKRSDPGRSVRVSTSQLIRLGGLAAVVSGALFVIAELLYLVVGLSPSNQDLTGAPYAVQAGLFLLALTCCCRERWSASTPPVRRAWTPWARLASWRPSSARCWPWGSPGPAPSCCLLSRGRHRSCLTTNRRRYWPGRSSPSGSSRWVG